MRRRALVVLAAVVPLAAVVVALVVSGGGSARTPRRLPIAVGSAAPAETMAARADMALYPYRPVRYEAAADLPLLGGTAHAYSVGGNPSDELIRGLADALGVQGDIVENESGFVTVGSQERQLSVQRTAGGSWYFGSGSAVSSSGVAVACAPDTVCEAPPTTIPERPAGLPSEDEATKIALNVVAASGVDVEHATVTTHDFVTQWMVTVEPIVDGLQTKGFTTSVSIGPDGVQYANGFLGRIEQADEYPLLDTRAAIDQLNAGGGYYGGGPQPAIAFDTATANVATAAGGAPTDAPTDPAPPETTTTIVCITAPCEVPPDRSLPPDTIEPQIVTLTGVTLGLTYAPSYNGDAAYLVPAYVFTTADGEGPTTLAIDDAYLLPPDQATTPKGEGRSEPGEPGQVPGTDPDGSTEVPCSTPGYVGNGPCWVGPPVSAPAAPPETITTDTSTATAP